VQFVAVAGTDLSANAFIFNAVNMASYLRPDTHALEVQSTASYAHATPVGSGPVGGCAGDNTGRRDVCDGQVLLRIQDASRAPGPSFANARNTRTSNSLACTGVCSERPSSRCHQTSRETVAFTRATLPPRTAPTLLSQRASSTASQAITNEKAASPRSLRPSAQRQITERLMGESRKKYW
jgi:hypothetical protein